MVNKGLSFNCQKQIKRAAAKHKKPIRLTLFGIVLFLVTQTKNQHERRFDYAQISDPNQLSMSKSMSKLERGWEQNVYMPSHLDYLDPNYLCFNKCCETN